jgi:hypothetical protein
VAVRWNLVVVWDIVRWDVAVGWDIAGGWNSEVERSIGIPRCYMLVEEEAVLMLMNVYITRVLRSRYSLQKP